MNFDDAKMELVLSADVSLTSLVSSPSLLLSFLFSHFFFFFFFFFSILSFGLIIGFF